MADYTKSPVFSSPAYWIALGVGVVGIGAAAWQERNGSAAKVYDTPYDPSMLSDRPGSMTPRQYMALKRMDALMPHGKDVHGKTMQLSNRQAAGLIRSMGEMRRADKAGMRGSAAHVHRGSGVAYNVYLRGKLIDTVFQSGASTVEEVKRSLIDHDGYDAAIRVTKAARSSGSGSMADTDNRTWVYPPSALAAEKKRLVNYSEKLTFQRMAADEAMLNRRFGGLVSLVSGMPRSITKTGAIDAAEANHTLWTLVHKDNGAYLRPGRHWPNDRHRAYYKSKLPWTNADLDLEIAWSK